MEEAGEAKGNSQEGRKNVFAQTVEIQFLM